MKIIIQGKNEEGYIYGITRIGNTLTINVGTEFIEKLMKDKQVEGIIPDKFICDYLRERGINLSY